MNKSINSAMAKYPVFLGSEIDQPTPSDAHFHILPVPWERSVSYGAGTAMGPAKILQASWQLETWDGQSNPSTVGIYTHPPVDVHAEPQTVVNQICDAVKGIVAQGALPIAIGGEHTVTMGVIQGLLDAGVCDIGVVQIDAHADLREAYEGDRYSHASVMHRIAEMNIPICQLGVRAYCEEEISVRKRFRVHSIDADVLVQQNIQDIVLPDNFPDKVFFTLDIDGMDPSIFPSTGTPVPGGLGWYQTLSLFESICRQRHLVGFDIMEFAPIEHFPAYDFSAAQLIYKMMGIYLRNKNESNDSP